MPNSSRFSASMPRLRLTDITISKLPQSKAQVTHWDEGLPAFGVRVGARRKTFIVVMNGGRRIKLGNYPVKSLKDAKRLSLTRDRLESARHARPYCEPARQFYMPLHHAPRAPD